MTMSPNCCGVVSRPCVWTLSSKPDPPRANGGAPTLPAATWTFCARRALTISIALRLRAAAFSGSIQMRIA